MADDRLIQEWMVKADEDLAFARVNFEEGRNFHAQICFHFQQSAEKYLKAFIVANQLEFRKVHDLVALLNQCLTVAPSLADLQGDCEYLNAFYIEARYPVHWPTHYSTEETEKGLKAAIRIQSLIKLLLRPKSSQTDLSTVKE
jgi:HEPN domain-containing protein